MKSNAWWRLCVMMFLEYMVWGLWNIKLGSYLPHLGFDGTQIGLIFSAFFFACLLSPFVFGQIADRIMPTQIFLGLIHLIGGAMLLWLGELRTFSSVVWVMFGYSLLYGPTLALTNSLCFHHLKDVEREFGGIRMWGTIGWIAAGLFLTFWWTVVSPFPFVWQGAQAPAGVDAAQVAQYVVTESRLFTLAGAVSILLGLFCFALPHTPPSKESPNPLAFLGALRLLKDPSFAVFMLLCFVVSTELMFYYILTPPFLESSLIGIQSKNTSAVMTIFAQGAEILTLSLLLPRILPNWGLRKTMALGIIAWPVRYAIFSLAQPWWLVVLALTLHGFCYVFFLVVGQIYVDTVAPKDIRASAQSLFFIVTFGLGLSLGSYFVGWVINLFTDAAGVVNYQSLFLVPTGLTILCAVIFLFFFKEPPKPGEPVAASH